MNAWVALVTLLSLLLYLVTLVQVGQGRGKHGIEAPAMTGHPDFERLVRVQANTLEGLVLYLPCLWLCALYTNALLAAGLGVVWIVGRGLYAAGYARAAASRSTGFMVQAGATLALLLAAFYGVVRVLVTGGAA